MQPCCLSREMRVLAVKSAWSRYRKSSSPTTSDSGASSSLMLRSYSCVILLRTAWGSTKTVFIQENSAARSKPQLRVRSRDIVFICIAYIPPGQSLPPSLPHPCQSVARLKDSQPNLAGEIVAAYLVGNGFTPSFFHKLGRGGWG